MKLAALVLTTSAVLLVATFAAASGPVSSPAPSPVESLPPALSPAGDCFSRLLNLSDCLDYVIQGSNETVPEKVCCSELAGLVESRPICLCQLLGNTSVTLGIPIDVSKALKLPSSCGVSTPPASLCAGAARLPNGGTTSSPTTVMNKDNGGALGARISTFPCFIGFVIALLSTLFV